MANGATLKYEGAPELAPVISHLKLDADATGVISGFSFAVGGLIELSGQAPSDMPVAVNLSEAQNLHNVTSWAVKIGGKNKPNYRVRATAEGFAVVKRGLVLSVR